MTKEAVKEKMKKDSDLKKDESKKYASAKTAGKSRTIFYSIYAGVIVLLIAAIAIFLSKFEPYLASFEAGLPKYKAQEVFEKYFEPVDFGVLYDKCGVYISKYEGRDEFVKYMNNFVGSKTLTYRDVPSGDDAVKRYVVTDGKNKISEFTLVEKGEGDEKGNRWIEDSFRVFFAKPESIKIRIPSDSKLYVNNVETDFSSLDKAVTEDVRNSHLPEGVKGITYTEFTLDGFLLAPTLRTVDRFGNEGHIAYNEKEKLYSDTLSFDVLPDDVASRVEGAAQTYAKYMTLDSSLTAVRQYYDPTSDIYTFIRTSDTWCYTPHNGYKFDNIEISEYYVYDADAFSCRYKCNQYIYTSWETFDFPLDITLYFKNVNGKMLAYDMVSNY